MTTGRRRNGGWIKKLEVEFLEIVRSHNSSITKNFVISGKEQVEMFVNAIEEFAKNRPVHIPVAESEITDDAELLEFMRMRKSCYHFTATTVSHSLMPDRPHQMFCLLACIGIFTPSSSIL